MHFPRYVCACAYAAINHVRNQNKTYVCKDDDDMCVYGVRAATERCVASVKGVRAMVVCVKRGVRVHVAACVQFTFMYVATHKMR